ncbi:MAG TPA: hypothetical protein VD837_04385 [Terriglobales bacterium]|nr:hypothetical protein [Terriglobales bacterium]
MNRKALYAIFYSWDFCGAVITGVALRFMLHPTVLAVVAKDIYSAGISVLSIVFAVFFASLAIIMSSGDDVFVKYLHEEGHYGVIIQTFRFTLLLLFAGLVLSIVLYSYSSAMAVDSAAAQSRWLLISFGFLSSWALLASLSSTLNSITYSHYRYKFLSKAERATSNSDPR